MERIKKAVEISDAQIQFVSLVDKAANKRNFLIVKAENGSARFSVSGKILKVDDTTHYLTGIVYEPCREDAHGNYMTEEEIRKAAYWFAKNGDEVDIQHSFKAADGLAVVESYIAPCGMEIEGAPIVKGTWLMTVEVGNPKVWEAVQKGEITGFSMGGIGKYSKEDIDLDSVGKQAVQNDIEAVDKKGILKKLAAMIGLDETEKAAPVVKTGKRMSSANKAKLDEVYQAFSSFKSAFDENEEGEITVEKGEGKGMNQAEITAIVEQAVQKAMEATAKQAEPAPQNVASAPDENNIENLVEKAVKKALAESGLIEPEPENEPLTKAALETVVSDTVSKALEPLLKARGIASNLNGQRPVEKSEAHYLAGIL